MRQPSTVEPKRGRSVARWSLAVVGLAITVPGLVGCGPAAAAGPLEHPDAPIPPGEPRAELRLELDLAPALDCEEAFDLAMYRDRGIELIEWDDRKGSCESRTILVRYLSRQLTADAVRTAARSHARHVRAAAPVTPEPQRPTP